MLPYADPQTSPYAVLGDTSPQKRLVKLPNALSECLIPMPDALSQSLMPVTSCGLLSAPVACFPKVLLGFPPSPVGKSRVPSLPAAIIPDPQTLPYAVLGDTYPQKHLVKLTLFVEKRKRTESAAYLPTYVALRGSPNVAIRGTW